MVKNSNEQPNILRTDTSVSVISTVVEKSKKILSTLSLRKKWEWSLSTARRAGEKYQFKKFIFKKTHFLLAKFKKMGYNGRMILIVWIVSLKIGECIPYKKIVSVK